jgi:hypothetical protein
MLRYITHSEQHLTHIELQLVRYTVQKYDLLGWIEPAVEVDGGVDVWAVVPHHVQHWHLQRPAHSKPLWLSLKLWRRQFSQ